MIDEAAYADAQTMYEAVAELVFTVGEAQGWTDEQMTAADEALRAALDDADADLTLADLWGDPGTAGDYLTAALDRLDDAGIFDLPGGDKLETAIKSALDTTATRAEEEELGSASTIAAGTVEGSLDDAAQLAQAAQDASIKAAQSPLTKWVIVGGLLLGFGLLVRR